MRNAPELSTTTAPALHRDRRPLRGHLVRHVEHRDVDAVEDLGRQRLDDDVLAAHAQDLAGRAGEATRRISPQTSSRCDMMSSMTVPTAPVAPTMARVGLRVLIVRSLA